MNKAIFEYNGKEYYLKDIVSALKKVGINLEDSIFVHSNLKSFGKINNQISRDEFIGCFVEALKQAIGDSGNIIVPTFSYSFCKKEVFDPENTPSSVGALTNYFRKLSGVKRSIDAIFSVAVFGPDKDYFIDVGMNCFGEGSIFEKLYEKNVKIVFLGETFDMTYIHFIEQRYGVPYRFIKEFKGQIKFGNELKEFIFYYNVWPLDIKIGYNLEGIADFLNDKGVLRKEKLGNSKIRVVSAVDAFDAIADGLKENIKFLLKEDRVQNKDAK